MPRRCDASPNRVGEHPTACGAHVPTWYPGAQLLDAIRECSTTPREVIAHTVDEAMQAVLGSATNTGGGRTKRRAPKALEKPLYSNCVLLSDTGEVRAQLTTARSVGVIIPCKRCRSWHESVTRRRGGTQLAG